MHVEVPSVESPKAKSVRHRFAVFDLDRTITRRGTYSLFLIYAARHLSPARLFMVPVVLTIMVGYKVGLISRMRLKEVMQQLMLGKGVAQDKIHAISELFADRTLSKNVYAQAIELIEREKSGGALIVIASAAHHFYLDALGKRLNADFVIGTESTYTNGILRPKIVGENCYGAEKRQKLSNFFQHHKYERAESQICFYSDDLSDLPSFQFADEAVATNPSRKLAAEAKKLKWEILDWRL